MKQYQYQVGGSLVVDAVCYVAREADSQLYRYLLQGECCYILNSRQMNKSSLLVQTFYRLKKEGYLCAIIDLTTIGSEQITPLQWYKGITAQICLELGLTDIFWLKNWWREQENFSYLQILSRFIDELLSVHFSTERIFIFIDEIDTIISLDFTVDDFFALIRYCQEKRTTNPNYKRITFALAGVATPSDLIRDKNGKKLVSAAVNGTVKLWTIEGKNIATLNHQAAVYRVTYSPDGKIIASGSDRLLRPKRTKPAVTVGKDRTVKLWQPNGTPIATLQGHQAMIVRLTWSHDGQTLASGSADGTIKLWSRDGKLLNTLEGHQGEVWGVQFSQDDTKIYSASLDGTVKQ